MCSVGEDCCRPPTETELFARSANQTSRKQGQAAIVVGGGCCEAGCYGAPGHSFDSPPVEQMEFWGTEVTPGKPQVIQPGDDTYVHVSQVFPGRDLEPSSSA
ncbi:unnamed protein product [Calypogeia fissa]